MRRRLIVLEAREKARIIAAEVEEGISETSALAEERGGAFVRPKVGRGDLQKPIRRMSGLEWLLTREPARITQDQKAMGERWGALWRVATGEASVRSCMNDSVGSGAGVSVKAVKHSAEARVLAGEKLDELNLMLLNQGRLLRALTEVCGRELTPREASRDGHDALQLECLVCVALDMLVEGAGRRIYIGA